MPYWRLSGFYFFFYASLGAIVPYFGLYLESLHFSPTQIGSLMAMIMATRIISPNIWGWLADRTGNRMRIVRIGSLLALVAFSGVMFGNTFMWLSAVMLVFSFFWNAALPQFEATTLSHLGDNAHRYSSIRLWGSIGFIAAVAGLGPLFDHYGVQLMPSVVLYIMAGIWVMSMIAPEGPPVPQVADHQPLAQVLAKPDVKALLIICLLAQASHGPYYTFYSIYLADHGYSQGTIGQLWALGVIAEVGVFLYLHRIVPKIGLRPLLLFSLFCGILRWLLIGTFADYLPLLLVAQLLHAATFGIYHAVAIQLIHRNFTGKNQGRGQALYSSISFGAGGAIGSLYSGYIWSSAGSTVTFYVAAGISAVAFIMGWKMVKG